MSKFECPRLSLTEIVKTLRVSQIANITENDLKNPSKDLVSDLYARLLIYLDVFQEENLRQVEFALLEQVENEDHHVDSIRVMKLCNMIKKLVASLGCPVKFTLADLINPDPYHTELILSAILNLYLYKESKMNNLKPIMDELALVQAQQNEWEAKISRVFEENVLLNVDISSYYEARERELPFVQDIDAKVKELHQTIAGLNSHQISVRASFMKLKDKIGEMSAKISEVEFELLQSVQENANLRSEIVQSPNKLQAFNKMSKHLAMMQDIQEQAFNKMSKYLAMMQDIQEQVNSSKSIEKDNEALKAKLSDDVVQDKSLEGKQVELQAKVEHLDEIKIQLEKENNLKFKEANAELDNLKLEVESRRSNLEERRRNVEVAMAEVDAINAMTNSVKESGEAKLQELTRKCEEVMQQFQQYTNSLDLALADGGI